MEVLDGIYMEYMQKEKYKAYKDFRDYKRDSNMSVSEFILEYDKKIRRLKEYNITLPEEVYAFEVLESASLNTEQEALTHATVPELTLHKQ